MSSLLDNVLIDIAITLLLIYALLSLLVMKLQETVHGNWLAGRVENLHRLIESSVMNDTALARQVLGNPLIKALYQDADARPASWWFSAAKGPSAIPPALFARALLMELNPSLRPPQEEADFSPSKFVDAIDEKTPNATPRKDLVRALRGLLPGHEGDWAGFEAAVADWFDAAGERSEGWWKRRSSLVGFWMAFGICVMLNVDSGHIARAVAADAELRNVLVQAAGSVQQVRDADAAAARAANGASAPAVAAAPGTVAVVVDAETRTTARLVDAIARLRTAFQRDKEVQAFGAYASDVEQVCSSVAKSLNLTPTPPLDAGKRPADQHQSGKASAPKPDIAGDLSRQEGRFLSNSDTWQRVLPLVLATVEKAVHGTDIDAGDPKVIVDPTQRLREAHRCLVEVSAWVRAAVAASNQAATQTLLRDAAVALEDSKAGLLLLLRQSETGANVRALFRADPVAYADCAKEQPTSLAALERCVRGRQNVIDRLPIGLSGANINAQFCTVVRVLPAAAASQPGPPSARGNWDSLCSGANDDAPPIPGLRVDALSLRFASGWNVLFWLGGVLLSTFFVSLGAPFWFDLLSKLMRVRATNLLDKDKAARLSGEGTQPLPAPAAGTDGSAGGGARGGARGAGPRPGGSAGERSVLPGVKGAGNAFEDALSVRELQALQQTLGVKASGEFDEETRTAIANASRDRGLGETRYLSYATYTTLAGRPPTQARDALGQAPSSRLQRHQPNALVPLLTQQLATRMALFKQPIDPNATTLDDDLRALCVLWRYKTDATQPLHSRKVFELARSAPEQFDEIDEALLREITDPARGSLARENPAWLDWAIGELGQVEAGGASRGSSDKRVLAYLDAVATSLGDQGDKTAWCGAFVTWVLKRYNDEPNVVVQPIPQNNPAEAIQWQGWQRADPVGPPAPTPRPGDVVVIKVPKGHHVGFVLEIDASLGVFWMIGGNQDNGTRVCLSRFLLTDIV